MRGRVRDRVGLVRVLRTPGPARGMRGFTNGGNACFLNAALQCLLYTPQLSNYFLSECPGDDLLKKRVNACAVAQEFTTLVRALWTTPPDAPLNSGPFRAALAKVHKTFGNKMMQHDAHEALVAVLHTLHDALAKTGKIPESLAAPHVHLDSWSAHNRANYSFLTELFQGQLRATVAGPRYVSTTYDHFWDVSLAIDGTTASLGQALARYLEPTAVEGYKTPEGEYITATVTREVVYFPLVLVVHLKRFDNRRNKLDKFIAYDVDVDLPFAGNQVAHYTLFAVCLHSGDVAGGHYAAMCETHGRWWYLDDESARPVDDLNSIIQRDAYVLLYRRKGGF